MSMLNLSGVWRVYTSEENKNILSEKDIVGADCYNAVIPESFEKTLERSKVIGPLYEGKNILDVQKYEKCHLWYVSNFDYYGDMDNPVLVFDGIDTVADIVLNGKTIGKADNCFIPHEFSAKGIIEGQNEIMVHVYPAVCEAEKYSSSVKNSLPGFDGNAANIRKPAYLHGWDIMPRLMCGGIWKEVMLADKKEDPIRDLYFYTEKVEWQHAVAVLEYDTAEGGEIFVSGKCGNDTFEASAPSGKGNVHIDIHSPKLWSPKGMGKPFLYDVTVKLVKDGNTVSSRSFKAGIRVSRLNRSESTDGKNGDFSFYINGNRMFVLGTNYVPADAVLSSQKNRLGRVLELLDDSGCNMVRVWGGGVYEDDGFYTFCDEHGIAVWQDFCMACNIYPQDRNFAANLKKEAEYAVRRLRNHPCIMLWAGDNEVDSVMAEWYDEKTDPESNALTREVLKDVVSRLDPHIDYIPSSPYLSKECVANGTESAPENHLWGPRNYYKSDYYTKYNAHFVSETGYHGCPSADSVRKFISDGNIWPWNDNPEWIVHSSASSDSASHPNAYRIGLMARQAKDFFGCEPENIDEFSLISQISQMEADKYFIEHAMSGKWNKTGIIWWNLIDAWPQFSDSAVDYYFEKKLAYNAIKRLQQPLCLIVDDELNIRFINNTENETYAEYSIIDASSGETVKEGKYGLSYNANTVIGKLPQPEKNGQIYILRWDYCSSGIKGWRKGINHYLYGKPPFDKEYYIDAMKKYGII